MGIGKNSFHTATTRVTQAQMDTARYEVLRFATPMDALTRAFNKETLHQQQTRDGTLERFRTFSMESPQFYGFEGYPTEIVAPMTQELLNGWPEGSKLLSKVSREVSAMIPTSRRMKIESNHVSGFDPNVGDLLGGQPFAFRRWGKQPKPQVIRLAVNTAVEAGVPTSAMVWSGAVAMVLADMYTQAGYSVEIWAVDTAACFASDEEVNKTVSLVCAKRAEDQLLPDMLASVIVSPRFTRAVLLPLAWQTRLEMPDSGGSAWDCDESTLTKLAPDLAPMVCLPRVFSKADAVKQINDTIIKLGNERQAA